MKILAVQNRMGIGDTVIFLPFIKALYEKYNSPISLLIKEKSDEFFLNPNLIRCLTVRIREKSQARISKAPTGAQKQTPATLKYQSQY